MGFLTWLRRRSVPLSSILCLLLAATLYARCFSARTSPPADEAPASARLRRHVSSSPGPFGLENPESDSHANTSAHLIAQRQTVSTGDVTYYCSLGTPCSNGACCGQSGICGYGPTYCGTGCTSNCDAHAPCGQYSESGSATCPLNVCCSQFGFCGTTSDFCGVGCQSNCGTPSSPGSGGDVRQTVIGYYESWRADIQCSGADPSQIPAQGLTGLNFAFVYVLPDTYDIVPMDGVDSDLFARVTDAKVRNPDLTVSVSIGGWDFSDDGTVTQPVFGDIASSLLKRATFARKLYQFMIQYGFDGVDLDWEYPGAPDRGGTPADVDNYPLLLQMIRFIWQLENKSFRLSVTAPTSYWYLQWFDLPGIVQYVDYVNLMAYDLHGVWDSTDPIGPFVYAHTNLTEIDAALSLFWRDDISPSQINLGLAFYGRTFTLSDPSCIDPGCPFSGPGLAGYCSATAGILSYREIESLLVDHTTFPSIYDATAAVNYAVYGGGQYWVSYDDSVTFQQKVDYANSQGLHGLFIWAVDMDDSAFSALRAVTGQQDLTPAVPLSDTLGNWNTNDCYTTACGWDCAAGWVKMTGLNLDSNGNGCPNGGRNSQQRSFCCPPWGAPDPNTCTWRGSGFDCFGQCVPGEVLMTVDNYGGSSHCNHGVKAFCCPATSGNAAEAACRAVAGDCPPDVPQKIGSIAGSGWASDSYCCPAAPVWENCAWHGNRFNCANNRCPAGQIEMVTDTDGPGLFFGCILGRQMAFCCDPPFGGTAFVPVPMEDLFPETIPASDAPVYYEAFDHAPNETPQYDPSITTDDPNREPFAWTIMVGAAADVQTLRRRDGSHLETFDCPNPDPSDYSIQKLKAVCMVDGDDHNCEDVLIGGARGTIIRLPEECGPDEWVRLVSFKRLEDEDVSLPAHLEKRAPSTRKVYEIRYDYNFRLLRRDGGEVYVRFDASTHPGYWSTIVSSSPNDTIVLRTPEEDEEEDWRTFHAAWFERHQLAKRGFGTTDSWWLDRFNILLSGASGGLNYGLTQSWSWNQVLYSAQKNCPPSTTAYMEAVILGELTAQLDYGISLIGTLRNFDFSESYAFFRLNGLDLSTKAELNGNAGFTFQSQTLPLLNPWAPFGGSFNIKGLWTVGPYIEVTAQIQALATVSGAVSAGLQMSMPIGAYTYMFPQSLNEFPSGDDLDFLPLLTVVTPGQSATITTAGSFTITATPAIGFQIQLDAFGVQLVNTKAVASFANTFTLQVGANSPECEGAYYELLYGIQANIDLIDPLPGWSEGSRHINVYSRIGDVRPMECYTWSSDTLTRRSPATLNGGQNLTARAPPPFNPVNSGALFPDLLGSLLSCPNDINTPTGDCLVDISDFASDGGAVNSKRDLNLDLIAPVVGNSTAHTLEKRVAKTGELCGGISLITYRSPQYPTSSQLIGAESTFPFSTYGPLNPDDCNDYSFGQVSTPPASNSIAWTTEHVLEWQLLGDFWSDYIVDNDIYYDNPASSSSPGNPLTPTVNICKYLSFWWYTRRFTLNSIYGYPIDILANAFPGSTGPYRSELTLLDKQTNLLKEAIWWTSVLRDPNKMTSYNNGDVNKAINICKSVLNAMKYMQLTDIETILVDQATRVGTYMDDIEAFLATYNDPSFNRLSYQTLGLGNEWRKWMYNQYTVANTQYTKFINTWVPAIEAAHASDQNPAIVARVTALVAAYNDMPPWINPFPAAWASA